MSHTWLFRGILVYNCVGLKKYLSVITLGDDRGISNTRNLVKDPQHDPHYSRLCSSIENNALILQFKSKPGDLVMFANCKLLLWI